jgi:putative ABC transport system permease protein
MKSQSQMPPKLPHRFFRWYCHPKLVNHIEGDLLEVYNRRVEAVGATRADIQFAIDVLLLLRPDIIKPFEGYQQLNSYGMYKSYFKIGWRNLWRNKGYSFINIGGLAVGMSIAILIGLWIHDELNFNTYHKNYKSIARVLRNGTLNGETFTNPGLPYDLGEELKTKYGSTFKDVVIAWNVGDHILSAGEKNISLSGEFMEPGGMEMFSLNLIHGGTSGLSDAHSILLSETTAVIFFGSENPIGKLLTIDNRMEVTVTGVYQDLPHNSHFSGVKFFAPLDLLVAYNQWIKYQGFTNNFLHIYASISDHNNFESASSQIKDAILNNIQNDKEYVAINPQIFLHPMKKWHLWSDWKNGINTGGKIQTVWLFGIVGAFVLLLACINFMNLSTARSEKRSKEVGIRKTIGSMRTQLIGQFFSESFLVVILAFIIALALVSMCLSGFNELAGKQIEMPWSASYFWLSSVAFILITGSLAGCYPALYLSSFKAISTLKGSMHVGRFASIPRKVLVVVQFTVSITLIIGTVIIYQQIQFTKNRSVGYMKDGLLMVQMTSPEFHEKYEALQIELKNTGAVIEMAKSSSPLTDVWNSNGGFDWNGKDPALMPEFATHTVTPDYGKTIGWQIVEGRDFSNELASDSTAFVINQAAAKILGFKNPVGEVVRWRSWWTKGVVSFTVIGVTKNIVMKSPYAPPAPAVYFFGGNPNWISMKVDPRISTNGALLKIESVFKKIIPSVPFAYKFADQEYALKFASEERVGKLASVFALLAILISCLGLFGLASYVAEQRTKEIGIRKVVGASVLNLWMMLSKDFVALVIVSSITAIPIAYYFLSNWLQQFDYRMTMSWWVFGVTGLGALLLTLFTVSYQAVKAAMVNPVKSLRSE